MAADPNLSADECTFMNPGSPEWWLSEDVKLTAPSGVAAPGMKNGVNITVRRKSGCTLPDPTDFIKVDLYVCNPTASPLTTTSPNVKKILDSTVAPTDIIVDITSLPAGGSFTQTIQWDLPPLTGTSHPAETAGHKCLIARAYSNFIVSGGMNIGDYAAPPHDQHYAQRNICVQTCSSPCGIDVWTENIDKQRRQEVTFEVFLDTDPSEETLKVALPLLQEVPGFKRVVKDVPAKGFGLEFPNFPDVKKNDNTRSGCLGGITKMFGGGGGAGFRPSFSADVVLPPSKTLTYRFVTDLDGATPGDAYIFHLNHIEGGNVMSGLTMLMVKK